MRVAGKGGAPMTVPSEAFGGLHQRLLAKVVSGHQPRVLSPVVVRFLVLFVVLLATSIAPRTHLVFEAPSEVRDWPEHGSQLAVLDSQLVRAVAGGDETPSPPGPVIGDWWPLLPRPRSWQRVVVFFVERAPRELSSSRVAADRDRRPAIRRLRGHASRDDLAPNA